MGSSSGAAMANDSMAELFGPRGRRPLLSNTLRTLSRIYSLYPEENPFAQFPDFPRCHSPAGTFILLSVVSIWLVFRVLDHLVSENGNLI